MTGLKTVQAFTSAKFTAAKRLLVCWPQSPRGQP
jgi:hypothetical protein